MVAGEDCQTTLCTYSEQEAGCSYWLATLSSRRAGSTGGQPAVAGSKGERYYDWARVAVNCDQSEGFQRWLLFRRSLEHPDDPRFISYYQVFAPNQISLETMAEIAGQRWRIEECLKFAKDSLSLGEYEVRSWHGWYRHITLVLAAQTFLSVLRHQAEPAIGRTTPPLPLVTTRSLSR